MSNSEEISLERQGQIARTILLRKMWKDGISARSLKRDVAEEAGDLKMSAKELRTFYSILLKESLDENFRE